MNVFMRRRVSAFLSPLFFLFLLQVRAWLFISGVFTLRFVRPVGETTNRNSGLYVDLARGAVFINKYMNLIGALRSIK